ncbi:C2H2-type zinc finger protein [Kistimonas scapharcae]|uniref:C2H2-type zinc finger protein n=1 Tax=Kistimonas scapharcae TaxID=1036133 RepID=UPI0031EB9419
MQSNQPGGAGLPFAPIPQRLYFTRSELDQSFQAGYFQGYQAGYDKGQSDEVARSLSQMMQATSTQTTTATITTQARAISIAHAQGRQSIATQPESPDVDLPGPSGHLRQDPQAQTPSQSQRIQCPHCPKTLKKNSYQVHLRQHTGEKPYKCPACDERFKQNGNCHLHIRKHHPGQPELRPIYEKR